VWRDEPSPPDGRGIARTGVTVVDLRQPVPQPGPAGGAILNGAGECTGFIAAGEWGLAGTPVFLTPTMQLAVYDAACQPLMAEDPGIGSDDVIIPIVASDDSFLNESRQMGDPSGCRPPCMRPGLVTVPRRPRVPSAGLDELPGFQGRHWDCVETDTVRAYGRGAAAVQLR
jgi:hypothetical protein